MECSKSKDNKTVDEWKSVTAKGKKKKKLKNARTLTLQNFFSEHGGHDQDVYDNSILSDCVLEETPEKHSPVLSRDQALVRASLHSMFIDNLRRSGPSKLSDDSLQAEMESITDEGAKVFGLYGSLSEFLRHCPDLVVIDDYVGIKEDANLVRQLAVQTLMSKVNTDNKRKETLHPCKSNVWNTPSKPEPNVSVDSLLQLPKVESLFTYVDQLSKANYHQMASPKRSPVISSTASTSDLMKFPQMLRDAEPSPKATAHGPIGPSLAKLKKCEDKNRGSPVFFSVPPSPTADSEDEVAELNKKLQALTTSNADLVHEASEKDEEISRLKCRVESYSAMEAELKSVKSELANLVESNTSATKHTNLIISLQKQLDCEKLKVRNLTHQVNMERLYSSKIAENYQKLYGPISKVFAEGDSLGLRTLVSSTQPNPSPPKATLSSSASSSSLLINGTSATGNCANLPQFPSQNGQSRLLGSLQRPNASYKRAD